MSTNHHPHAFPSPQDVVDYMMERDSLSKAYEMKVKMVGHGYALVEMAVKEQMLNGFGICHGGAVTALADSAFAFACNASNNLTVASSVSVEFLSSAVLGDVLIAEAHERSLKSRLGLYEIQVHNQENKLVATMVGRSYRLEGKMVIPLERKAGL
jgi:acyl-CoA thioesterase